jgi:5'-nucleotidase
MRRRRFLKVASAGAAGTLLVPDWLEGSEASGALPAPGEKIPTLAGFSPLSAASDEVRLIILHTNDTHSRIDPFPMDGGPYQGLGGVARRATLIDRIRDRHPNVLLLDSGDIFQGTPYFNFFKGAIEFEAMSAMGYDVVTIGNHDFDNGVDGLVEMMPRATFDFVSANYEVAGSPLEARVQPWVVREVGGTRIGIFGLGIAFDGLVLEGLHQGVRYTDPLAAARRCVLALRALGCSLVICLSHLGYRYGGDQPSDTLLAQRVEGIDLILGGHTHTFMDEPDVYSHPNGRKTLVNQVGWGGMRVGCVEVVLGPPERTSSSPGLQPVRWGAGFHAIDATLD